MAETNLKKAKQGYGYKYTELAQINEYLEEKGISYYQTIETEDGTDYVYTVPIIDGKTLLPRRGCRVIQASLSGKSNPAQEQGSAITYARRYSLLMAFGLATEDDDAASLTRPQESRPAPAPAQQKADPQDLDLLNKLMEALKKEKIEPAFVCSLFGVKAMADMSNQQLKHALDHVKDIKKKMEEKSK